MATPSLKPIQLKEHTCKQGHYGDIVPELHMRSMLVGPSGSGKTVLLIAPNPPTKSSLFRALESRSPKRSAWKCIV